MCSYAYYKDLEGRLGDSYSLYARSPHTSGGYARVGSLPFPVHIYPYITRMLIMPEI